MLTWAQFGPASRELARTIADDDFVPDLILAIARGGLLVGGALGYALDLKNVLVINVEFYTGVNEHLPVPIVVPPAPAATDLAGARVLIADDVADSGATIRLVREQCAGHAVETRCAVLYQKPPSQVECEYVWRRADRWINFPWSTEPPLAKRRS